jgi:hypothetical protein
MKRIIHEITHGNDEEGYRTYITCYADNGDGWEVRASGETKEEAEKKAKERYEGDSKKWKNDGMRLDGWTR